jgi:hypothetical protein
VCVCVCACARARARADTHNYRVRMSLSCMRYTDAPFLLYIHHNGTAFNTLIRATSRTITTEPTPSGQAALRSIKHHSMCYPKIHKLTPYCYTALTFRRRRRRLRDAWHSDAISQASLFIHVWESLSPHFVSEWGFSLTQTWGFSLTQTCLSGFLIFGPGGYKGTRHGGHLELS